MDYPNPDPPGSHLEAGNPSQPEPIAILLAGPVQRVSAWTNLMMADGRFRVTSLATDPFDLRSKLASNPEALLLDAAILEGEAQLVELLTRFTGAAYVVTPIQAGQEITGRIQKIASVRGAFYADLNLAELAGRIYADTIATRQTASAGLNGIWHSPSSQGGGPTGLRIISVWNQMGGVGKTTVSTNLAYEFARRGFPTLLIGLGAPDDLPLILGLKPTPNVTSWWTNPTPEGIRMSIQKLDTLDVLGGFPDVLSESQAASVPDEAPNSIPRMIHTAAHYAGYAVIVVDAPPSALAARAISASNTLVLVARPSLEGVMRTVEAYRTVVERLAGEHCIAPENVHVALNRVGGRLDANEWHRAASFYLGRNFPPIVAQIPDSLEVGINQDNRRLPLLTCDEFSRALRPLVDAILRTPHSSPAEVKPMPARKVINLGIAESEVVDDLVIRSQNDHPGSARSGHPTGQPAARPAALAGQTRPTPAGR